MADSCMLHSRHLQQWLTVTKTGNLSEHFWGSGELITQWSIELNVTVNSATLDSTGLQVAVAHTMVEFCDKYPIKNNHW